MKGFRTIILRLNSEALVPSDSLQKLETIFDGFFIAVSLLHTIFGTINYLTVNIVYSQESISLTRSKQPYIHSFFLTSTNSLAFFTSFLAWPLRSFRYFHLCLSEQYDLHDLPQSHDNQVFSLRRPFRLS
jgi:hypothetical protein